MCIKLQHIDYIIHIQISNNSFFVFLILYSIKISLVTSIEIIVGFIYMETINNFFSKNIMFINLAYKTM
jgi:hypothetical protein